MELIRKLFPSLCCSKPEDTGVDGLGGQHQPCPSCGDVEDGTCQPFTSYCCNKGISCCVGILQRTPVSYVNVGDKFDKRLS